MYTNNTHEMNKRMSFCFLACTFALISLLIFNHFELYSFNPRLVRLIAVPGIPLTLLPFLLNFLSIPDEFLKYFMTIYLSVFIGTLATFNDIGIYISFVFVPVASCLYFDAVYTIFCSAFMYIIMVISVYINSAGRYEVLYLGQSHMEVFLAYIIGFTMEYIVIIVCLYQILKRANVILKNQHDAYLVQIAQDARYKLLIKETSDVIFEYFPNENIYSANRSIYRDENESNEAISTECTPELFAQYPAFKQIIDYLNEGFASGRFKNKEFDMTRSIEGQSSPLWYSCECFLVKDGDKDVSVIGKLSNITRSKLLQEHTARQKISDYYYDSNRRTSLYAKLQEESSSFTDSEWNALNTGHQFIANLVDSAKYEDNLVDAINRMIREIGLFFHIDRICILETDMTSGYNTMNYQWNLNESTKLVNYFGHMTRKQIQHAKETYDKHGYLEFNPSKNIGTGIKRPDVTEDNTIDKIMLGNQLWIPTISEGSYTGAIFFDRIDTELYSAVDKFLLSEAVNNLSTLILKANAESANKAKSDFLSTMSHEIRTPMNAIVGMTEVALREDMPSSVKESLMMVKSSAFGLLTLINDILDFSKIEAGKFDIVPEKFSPLSLIKDVKEIASARNKNKLDIILNVPDNLPCQLYADEVRIRQVMINFCSNAIKYTDEGHIELVVNIEKISSRLATFEFSVNDTGIGIKEEDIPKLFKSYTQVDTTINHHKEGTGLGLAICKQLVELMNGSVRVTSEYGKGSSFSFAIPVEVIDWSAAGALEDYRYDESTNAENEDDIIIAPSAQILIVDDTPINLMVAKALMEPTEMKIDTAASGLEALELIKEKKYDIIFMDHFMPELDGVETTQRIRSFKDNANHDTIIIALTADAMSGVREELISAGMDDFLSKPIIVKTLYQMLRKWLPTDKVN